MRDVSLDRQAYAYWIAGRDLRLAREYGHDDSEAIEDIADLANFTDHPSLRRMCLSRVKCDVAQAGEAG